MKQKWQVILLGAVTLLSLGAVFFVFKDINISPRTPVKISSNKISTVIVPHFDLGKLSREKLLSNIGSKASYDTVILASPDHFAAASSPIVSTTKDWRLQNAIIPADAKKIQELISNSLISNQESAFTREHGISNILTDIANSFPNAKVIPLMLANDASEEKLTNLANGLQANCKNCLLIGSVDFSHYQPGSLAEIHDSLSIRALENLDEEFAQKAEVDSPETLRLAIKWAKLNQTINFRLSEETNSGKIAGEPDSESTSMVFGYYQTRDENPKNTEATFMLGGDMMFDRYIASKFRQDLSSAVKNLGERFFWGTDVSLVNLEGPISAYPVGENLDPENLIFNFPPKTTQALKYLHLDAVSLANNHSLNAGLNGLQNTQKVLENGGIVALGDQNHLGVGEFGLEQKIAIFTINTSSVNTNLSDSIAEAKSKGEFVIVFPHWGSEYAPTHNSSQQRLAHAWIDAGADLVVGSHPHVIQDAELYQNKPIFYSLGNLLFDQSFSTETQRGLVIAGKISDTKLQLVILPVRIRNFQPELIIGEEKSKLVNVLREDLGKPPSENIYGYDMITLDR